MKKASQDIISEYLGVQPVFMNSGVVSAQNRNRLYWTNIPGFQQPEDKKIYLKDIIVDGFVNKDKSYCLDANYYKGGDLNQYFNKHRRQIVCGAMRGRYIVDGKRQDAKQKTAGLTTQRLELRKDEKTNTITTVQKDNYLVVKGVKQLNPSTESNSGTQPYQQNRIYAVEGKGASLTASLGPRYKVGFIDGEEIIYRKLTPVECERLQTVPDNYTELVSNTQRYRMLGNGWTVDAIVEFFKHLVI